MTLFEGISINTMSFGYNMSYLTSIITKYLAQRGYHVSKADYEYYYNSMRETFFDEQYKWLVQSLKPHTIAIDMGAQTGDSAIYLLQHGIKSMICYEPDETAYSLLKKNLLGRSAKFRLFNRNVQEPFWPIPGTYENPIIIKCDVEGAEHRIFTKESVLEGVYRIQIEYHNGAQQLPKVLKSKGFHVKVEKPWTISDSLGEVGWLYAWR